MFGFGTRRVASAGAIAFALWTAACGGDGSTGTMGSGGGGGGKPQSLYDKYGGEATVKKVVGQAVTGLTSDPKTAPFFTVVGMKGHDSAADLTGCLELFFTYALGGPATYPGKLSDGFECRDMRAAHAGLGITSEAFDEFVMDLGAVLKSDGVSDDDITTVAGALTGMKSDVVTK
jgi:hemoglobin